MQSQFLPYKRPRFTPIQNTGGLSVSCVLMFTVSKNVWDGDNFEVKVKVKCTLVQALRLCTGRMAHRGSRGIALLFHDHGTRRG